MQRSADWRGQVCEWVCVILALFAAVAGARAENNHPKETTKEATKEEPAPPYFWLNVLDPQRQEAERLIVTGAQAFKREHLISALRAFEESARRAPYITESSLFAGLVAAKLKQHDRAVEHFERFRALEPAADATYDLCFHLAISLSQLQRWEQTIAEYERCLAAAPPDDRRRIVYLANLGETYMAAGRLPEAIKAYEEALTFDQGLVHALLGLGVALERAQKPARETLREGLLLDPALEEMTGDNVFFIPPGDGYFQLGLMLEELGRVEDARRYYTKYLEACANPHQPQNHYVELGRERLKAIEGQQDALIKTIPSPSSKVTAAVVDGSLTWLALGTAMGQITLLRLDNLAVIDARTQGPQVMDLAFTPGAKELRVLLEDGVVLRFDPNAKMRPLGQVKLGAKAAPGSGRRAVSLAADGSAAMVLANTANALNVEVWPLNQPGGKATSILLHQPLADLVVASGEAPKTLFSIKGPIGVLQAMSDPQQTSDAPLTVGYTDAEYTPDAARIVAATTKGLVVLSGSDGRLQKLLLPLGDPLVQAVSLDSTGRYATAVTRSNLQIWDLSRVVFNP